MGFLQRLRNLSRPRQAGTGGLWDNTNTPGSVGYSAAPSDLRGIYPYENSFVPGPNPEPYLKTAAWKDPNRLHARADRLQPRIPVQEPKGTPNAGIYVQNTSNSTAQQNNLVTPAPPIFTAAPTQTRQRETLYDAANPNVLRIPDQPLQQYFNQREVLELVPTVTQYQHSVQCQIYPVQHGWGQAFVPEPGMHANQVGTSPPLLLSKPINSVTKTGMVDSKRAPLTGAKAPKRKRTGG